MNFLQVLDLQINVILRLKNTHEFLRSGQFLLGYGWKDTEQIQTNHIKIKRKSNQKQKQKQKQKDHKNEQK